MAQNFGQDSHYAANHQTLQPFDLCHFGFYYRQIGTEWRQRRVQIIAGDEFVLGFHDHTHHCLSLFGSETGRFKLVGNAQRVKGNGCHGSNLP